MHLDEKVDGDDDNDGNHADDDHNDHCDYNDDEEDDAEADICTWLRQLVLVPFTSYLLATLHHQSTRAQATIPKDPGQGQGSKSQARVP